MYNILLIAHSWVRWLAVVGGIGATVAALTGRLSSIRPDAADRWGLVFTIAMDLQLVLGLALYAFLSPITTGAFKDFGAAMRDSATRFWAVEHIAMMMLAIVMVHVGRVLGRKAPDPGKKRVRLLVCYAIATIAMLAAIPWPGMANGREFFRV